MTVMYANRLKYLREEKDLKQYDLSKRFGFSKEVYGNFERENTIMPIKYLIEVCDYFNCSLDYIFELTNNKYYSNSKLGNSLFLQHLRLKELRKKYNLTQVQLAENIGIANSTISDYENRNKIIGTTFLYNICLKYHISADYLLGKIDEPKYLK